MASNKKYRQNPKFFNGQSNQQYRRSNEVVPTNRPPVPIVLDPTPMQITPIGTIPIYSRRSSTTSQTKSRRPYPKP